MDRKEINKIFCRPNFFEIGRLLVLTSVIFVSVDSRNGSLPVNHWDIAKTSDDLSEIGG